jgi:hypothetical protein
MHRGWRDRLLAGISAWDSATEATYPMMRRAFDELHLEDRTTIAFAGFVEREFGGFTPPPHL